MRDNKQEWIKFKASGSAPVWHIPGKSVGQSDCGGTKLGQVVSVCYVELVPTTGKVCAVCIARFMNRLKLNAQGFLKRKLIKFKLKEKINAQLPKLSNGR